ncbi:MAG: ABC transporter permease [Parachlamydiales bacterium]|nr:ABC transporter permease [Verrucomicrobiota bacterium]MBX3719380.1 ABC transporter permease [Candidatus Acheromyda pituitae]
MLLRLAFRNLFRNVRRTIAVLMTIGLGAGALFCFQGFIHGVLSDYKDSTIHSRYGNGQINTKGYRDMVHKEPWTQWVGNGEELERFLLQQKGVDYVFPRLSLNAMLVKGKTSMSGHGLGIRAEKEAEFFNNLRIEDGVSLSNQENGIMLGKGLAKSLNVNPGDQVSIYTKAINGRIKKSKLTVTGIFSTGNMEFDNRVFRVQLEKAQDLLATKAVETLSLGLRDHENWDLVAKSIESAFPQLEATSFDELDKVYYQNSVDWLKAQFHVVQAIILSIVLLGIFNTISASILERKQEIGNLRANGESRFDIIKLILAEAAFLGALGSMLGLAFTYVISKGFFENGILMPPGPGSTRAFYLIFSFTWTMAISTMAMSVISAIIASFLAGLKVAKMPIAKALRS